MPLAMKAQEIRALFTEYFKRQGHHKIPSSSLIPQDDPTLLFANAGMNQFKDYFTGKTVPPHLRATTIQKCVRAGGKHNDLENVGLTARHHTFFEMLGNFSFGDYFKQDAIHFAWELLTKELAIPKDRLYITVHHSDHEAKEIWHKQEKISLDRIFEKGDKDNFWEMGALGPCGPCSEIFYDHGEDYATPGLTLLEDESRYIEIWNLVFMQFEKTPEGKLHLPRPSIDTGAGLERLATLLQGKYWNYDCDLFTGLIQHLEESSGHSYRGKLAASFRVVADHMRAATMLITDGVIPSHEGQGYVLRRIIRRAIRHLKKLGIKPGTFSQLVPTVFASLGQEYPQNFAHQSLAQKVLDTEEEKFLETLDSGIKFLENSLKHDTTDGTLPGAIAFKLYDTYGFPKDLTEAILKEKNLKLDHHGFTQAMAIQKETSRKSWKGVELNQDSKKLFYAIREKSGTTQFLGYQTLTSPGTLVAKEKIQDHYALVFDQTPFYGESGGQVGDQGSILALDGTPLVDITDTQKPVEDLHVLYANSAKGAETLQVGSRYTQAVHPQKRADTTKNHSATHLLQSALIHVLGNHIKQAGSHVSAERLRFDFTHPKALSKLEVQQIEQFVNHKIRANYDVSCTLMSKDKALKKGAIAMFGEKYGESVRVVQMGEASTELCGGTHVANLAAIEFFSITNETSLSSGVRRIEALTGDLALQRLRHRSELLKALEEEFSTRESGVMAKVHALKAQLKESHKEHAKLKDKIQSLQGGSLFEHPEKLGDLLFKEAHAPEGSDMRKLSDQFLSQHPSGILLLFSKFGKRKDKLSILLRVHKSQKHLDCAHLLRTALSTLGGKGGGRPDMAQGSVDASIIKTQDLTISIKQLITGSLP